MQNTPYRSNRPATTSRRTHAPRLPRWALLGAGLIGGGLVGYGAWRCRRKARIARGGIQPLTHVWRATADGCIHARVAKPTATSGRLPLVLVHGLGVSSRYFVPLAERLAVDFPVYVPELPGHGLSGPPSGPQSIRRMADGLIRWMDTLGLTEVQMIGNSMGCQTVVEAALRDPDRIKRLVLLGPHEPCGPTLGHYFIRLLRNLPFIHPALIPLALQDYARMGRHLAPELRLLLSDGLPRQLPQLTAPTLLVRGQKDSLAPRAWIEQAARLLGGAPIVEIHHWGHAAHYSAPDQVARAIKPFLLAGGAQARRWAEMAPEHAIPEAARPESSHR